MKNNICMVTCICVRSSTLARLAMVLVLCFKPAVNRQPGFRRWDSQSYTVQAIALFISSIQQQKLNKFQWLAHDHDDDHDDDDDDGDNNDDDDDDDEDEDDDYDGDDDDDDNDDVDDNDDMMMTMIMMMMKMMIVMMMMMMM